MTVTSYRAVKAQTDDTPNYTSINHHVHAYGCAVSPDLLKSGEVCYGDAVIIPDLGIRIVNDTTNPRLKRTIDIFVNTKTQEKRVGIRHVKVSVLRAQTRKCQRAQVLLSEK
jgi:3D (Asp-Asp-Asp) domain-containing protein